MLRRKSVLIGLIVLVLGFVGTALFLLVHHQPHFYVRNEVPPGKERKALSKAFFGQFTKLITNLVESQGEAWNVTFSEAQINSYFLEDFIRLGDAESFKKNGITEPRVALEKDK